MVTPGFSRDGLTALLSKIDFAGDEFLTIPVFDEAVVLPPPATSGMEGQVVIQHIKLGPTGDFVALVAGVASQLFGVISGLFGIGHDAVTDALKTLEKDVMGRIQVAKDTVDQIRNTVKFKIISEIIGSDENTLVTLNGYYNTMVQSHNL